jgi:flagellar hook assembly protein FlgD
MGITGDIRSISNSVPKSNDQHVEQMRQKIGTEFTAEKKAGKKKNELGKDDFMKLMSAQLKYQDPINPMKNEQMAAQLAQFSSLEQMMNMNNNLDKLAQAQKPTEHMIAATLIGKKVGTDSSRFVYEKGKQPEIVFDLPAVASSVSLAIVDEKGEVMKEFDLGAMKEGRQSVRWDGKNSKNQEQPAGEYAFKVTAADEAGKSISIKTDTGGIVTGVTFEAGKALLMVDGKKIPLESVGRIESDTAAAPAHSAPAKSAVKPLAADGKQDGSKNAEAANKATAQGVKKDLPDELDPEKIKSMLASLAPPSPLQARNESEEAGTQPPLPQPLWNPANAGND